MKKRTAISLGVIAIALPLIAIGFFAIAPSTIDRSFNRVRPQALAISPATRKLQATLDVADLHADSLLWKRDIVERSDIGHVDLPRLIAGHYALQVFSSVTKVPKGQN